MPTKLKAKAAKEKFGEHRAILDSSAKERSAFPVVLERIKKSNLFRDMAIKNTADRITKLDEAMKSAPHELRPIIRVEQDKYKQHLKKLLQE